MRDINILTNSGVNVQKALEVFGTMDKYDTTLEAFSRTIGGNVEKLKSYKETTNMPQYAVVVHSIKSEARYFGFTTLEQLAYNHEIESKNNNVSFIFEHFDELNNEISKIIDIVTRYLDKNESQAVNVQATVNKTEPKESFFQKIKNSFKKKEVSTPPTVESQKDKAIIVVDDSDSIREFINTILGSIYEIVSVNDGTEAVNFIERNPNKKIIGMLLDLNMPGLDGFSVLEYLREKGFLDKLPVCVITGTESKEAEEYAFKYKIMGMLKKPFNEESLKEQVAKFMTYNKE